MGNLYRFVEPVLLFLIKKKERSYGYELANALREYALTDAEVEVAALYRTLRTLEENNCVILEWDVAGSGPARRVYRLTPRGEEHLGEWISVLDHMSKSMARFTRAARSLASATPPKPAAKPAPRNSRARTEASLLPN